MIKVRNLDYFYKEQHPLFTNLSLNIKEGVYGLLGENGVGKTTFLNIISGLSYLKKGSCKVIGYESIDRNPNMLKDIFYLPEKLTPVSLTIAEFVNKNSVFYPKFSRKQIDEYLYEFELDKNMKISSLSYGQHKKVMIAYALALNTTITLLDEPTNGLDIPSKAQFRKIITSAFDEQKCIVVSTHQVRDLESIIDPIIILGKNEVLLNNSAEEITSKLFFHYSDIKPENSLYSEQTISGYISVMENLNNKESNLNLEALYNATINNKEKIKSLFNI